MFTVAVVEIEPMVRGPLSADELAALSPEGIPLTSEGRMTGERCPPGGVIRQRFGAWNWHPTLEHARAWAERSVERCFLVGDGINVEIPARSPADVAVVLMAERPVGRCP